MQPNLLLFAEPVLRKFYRFLTAGHAQLCSLSVPDEPDSGTRSNAVVAGVASFPNALEH